MFVIEKNQSRSCHLIQRTKNKICLPKIDEDGPNPIRKKLHHKSEVRLLPVRLKSVINNSNREVQPWKPTRIYRQKSGTFKAIPTVEVLYPAKPSLSNKKRQFHHCLSSGISRDTVKIRKECREKEYRRDRKEISCLEKEYRSRRKEISFLGKEQMRDRKGISCLEKEYRIGRKEISYLEKEYRRDRKEISYFEKESHGKKQNTMRLDIISS